MARISACAVGSECAIGELEPLPTTAPPMTTTAPTGTSPSCAPWPASASASRINSSSVVMRTSIIRKSTMAELEIHHESEHDADPLGRKVGVMAAVLAVLLAVVTIASHRTHTAAIMHKSESNDKWSEYQAARVKLHTTEMGENMVQLLGAKAEGAGKMLADYSGQKKKYERSEEYTSEL